ncbi:MAG TPA: hypothetical protein VGB85_34160 [Nannocystis sp.]|jgi:hypothetical protein
MPPLRTRDDLRARLVWQIAGEVTQGRLIEAIGRRLRWFGIHGA